jgi:cytoskeletal protein CcmA (bactofilin family)
MAAKDRESQEINIIGQSTYIDGSIRSQGNLRIDGRVHGSIITEGNFVVGLTGEIDGDVQAKNITVSGKFKGNVSSSEKLVLESNSKVNGDVNTKRLVVDDGAFFNGHCKMESTSENL